MENKVHVNHLWRPSLVIEWSTTSNQHQTSLTKTCLILNSLLILLLYGSGTLRNDLVSRKYSLWRQWNSLFHPTDYNLRICLRHWTHDKWKRDVSVHLPVFSCSFFQVINLNFPFIQIMCVLTLISEEKIIECNSTLDSFFFAFDKRDENIIKSIDRHSSCIMIGYDSRMLTDFFHQKELSNMKIMF